MPGKKAGVAQQEASKKPKVIEGVVKENDGISILLSGGERVWLDENTIYLRETGLDAMPIKLSDVKKGTPVYIGTKGQEPKLVATTVVIMLHQLPNLKEKDDKSKPLNFAPFQ